MLAGAAIGMPAILAACAPDAPTEPAGNESPTPIDTSNIAGATIKVGTYGGFFEENFRKMYPAFTEEFDVEVESVSEPTSEVWVTQLQQAIAADLRVLRAQLGEPRRALLRGQIHRAVEQRTQEGEKLGSRCHGDVVEPTAPPG